MNKRNLVVTFLLVCMLVSTIAFAETGSFRVGAGFVSVTDSEDSDLKALGYELTGRVWFAQLPQLTVNSSYSNLNWNEDFKQDDIALFAEYRVLNETRFGVSAKAGWLNRGYQDGFREGQREANNFITLGGKGNYVVTDNLQAIVDVSYSFNNLFEDEDYAKYAISTAKVGAEYDFPQVPGLKASAYFLYDKEDEFEAYGVNLGASYAMNF